MKYLNPLYLASVLLSQLNHVKDSYKGYSPECKFKVKDAYVLQDDKGRFYRGQIGWKWCKDPRFAAYLDKDFWDSFITWELERKGVQFELIKLTRIRL